MGFYSGLAAEKYDRQYSDKKLLERIAQYFKGQIRYLLIIVVSIIVRAIIEAISPVIVARGLDQVHNQKLPTGLFDPVRHRPHIGILSWLTNFCDADILPERLLN